MFNDKCELLYQVNEYNMFIAVPMMCGVSTWKIKHGISKLQQRRNHTRDMDSPKCLWITETY